MNKATRKSGRKASIVTDTARIKLWAEIESGLNRTLEQWASETAKRLQSEGIASFTINDGKALVALWKSDKVEPAAARKRLQRFRSRLESAGIEVVRDNRGGSKAASKASADAKSEKNGKREPHHNLTPTPQAALNALMAACAKKGGQGYTDVHVHLAAVAKFLKLQIA